MAGAGFEALYKLTLLLMSDLPWAWWWRLPRMLRVSEASPWDQAGVVLPSILQLPDCKFVVVKWVQSGFSTIEKWKDTELMFNISGLHQEREAMLLSRDWAPVESTFFLVRESHHYQLCTHQQVQVHPPFISFPAEILLLHPHYLPANPNPESLLFLFLLLCWIGKSLILSGPDTALSGSHQASRGRRSSWNTHVWMLLEHPSSWC